MIQRAEWEERYKIRYLLPRACFARHQIAIAFLPPPPRRQRVRSLQLLAAADTMRVYRLSRQLSRCTQIVVIAATRVQRGRVNSISIA